MKYLVMFLVQIVYMKLVEIDPVFDFVSTVLVGMVVLKSFDLMSGEKND